MRVPLFDGEGSVAPSPVRARTLRARSLNSPSLRKPSFPQRLPDAAAPGRLCPPPRQHRLPLCVPMRYLCAAPLSATGLRPHLTPAPTASRSATGRRRGIAVEAPRRVLRSTSRANKGCHASCCRQPAKCLAAIAQPPGIIGEASRWLPCHGPPRCRSPRLIRRRAWKVEEKVLFPAPILPACGCTTQAPKW